jgi:Heavy metal associated domain 2
MRWLQITHTLPGRTRLRFPALRGDALAGERIADALAATSGVHEVKVRPFTGSILVLHEPDLTSASVVEAAQRILTPDRILATGEPPPRDPHVPELSSIARLLAKAFREINRDVRRASEGSLDLGTVVTLGFFGLGAIDVAASRELPLPPWFTLAWWGYRTFMTNEQDAIQSADCVDADAD